MDNNSESAKPAGQKLPKLKVRGLGWDSSEGLHDFEEAKYFAFTEDLIVTLEGRVVNSFQEMWRLAEDEKYKDREYLEVIFLPVIVGG